jgi:hypothetical protein
MSDIIVGISIVLLASVAFYVAGVAAARWLSRLAGTILALSATAFLVWFAVVVYGTLEVVKWLPTSNAIALGNCIPLAAAFLAGMVAGDRSVSAWRRLLIMVVLLCLAWQTNSPCFPGAAPPAIDRWSVDHVCLQTTPASCSACCAVMLLRARGIRSDEPEMIRLCLTGPKGTPPLGLYRGLRLKTHGTPWKVEVVAPSPGELPRAETDGPVLVFVRLSGLEAWYGRNRPTEAWGDGRRSQHCVVVYQRTDDGHVLVGDPAQGVRRWSVRDLEHRWTGQGLRLVPR